MTHPYKKQYTGEVDPNSRAKILATQMYLHRSIERLELIAGRKIKSKWIGGLHLEKYKDCFLTKQYQVLKEYYAVKGVKK